MTKSGVRSKKKINWRRFNLIAGNIVDEKPQLQVARVEVKETFTEAYLN